MRIEATLMRSVIATVVTIALLVAGFAERVAAEAFIVRDGKPEAEIIIADTANQMQKLAAEELRHFIAKISGAELPITNKPTKELPVKIYVGASPFTKTLGVTAEGLTNDAYRMVSGDDYLVFVGNDAPRTFQGPGDDPFRRNAKSAEEATREWDELVGHSRWVLPGRARFKGYNRALELRYGDRRGSLMAVYGFLRSLGARWYFPGEFGECLPEMRTIYLPEVNQTVQPDFPIRHIAGASYKFGKNDREQALWMMRIGLGGPSSGGVHGIDYVIHRDQTRKEHPDWYLLKNGERQTTAGGGKPCLSSKGLLKDNIEYCRAYFDIYDADMVSVMPTDGYVSLCECDKCEGKDSPELGSRGRLSNYVWTYVNEVAKELYKTHPDKKVICCAYSSYFVPPPAIDKLSPNVMVMLNNGRRGHVDPEERKIHLDFRKEWMKKLTGERPFDTHDNYSPLGKSPFPCFIPRLAAKDIQSLKDICLGEYVEENALRPHHLRGDEPPLKLAINHLNIYVTARMWWDADQDVETMLEEYCEKFYGPASEEMKAFINFSEANWHKMKNNAELVDKTLELMANALKSVDKESVYGERVQLIDNALYKLKSLKDKYALGREDNGKVRIYRAGAVELDGILDERVWQMGVGRRFKKADKKRKNWYRTGWKHDNLYFAVHCEVPDVKALHDAAANNDDPAILEDDRVEILLETQNHAFYQIVINSAGAIRDADWNDGTNLEWNSEAHVAIHKGTNFWNAEIMIPVADHMQEVNLPLQMVSGRRPNMVETWYFRIARLKEGQEPDSEFHNPAKFKIFYME